MQGLVTKDIIIDFLVIKNHIAMTEDRIITALEVSSGEAHDGQYLKISK